MREQRQTGTTLEQLMAVVDALETQRATAANLLSALVAELTTVGHVRNGAH